MAVITVLSAKCSPGVSTTAAALAYSWPRPIVLADCDPGGGDLATGWLGHWLVDGYLGVDRGLLGYATATRHAPMGEPDAVEPHLQAVPVAPHVQLLRGLDGQAQHTAIGAASWRRLGEALRKRSASARADVVIDAGRFGPWTPPPLVELADLTLLAVRPLARHVLAAVHALPELARRVEPDRLQIAVLATTTTGTRDVRKALGHPIGLELPEDPRAAAVFSDGVNAGEPPTRSPLIRATAATASRLCHALNLSPPPHTGQTAAAPPERPQPVMGGNR